MADEHQTSALVTYFVTKLKLYIKANGHNELATEALEFYKNGMVEFHDEQNFQTKLTILKRQAIHDQLLEYIYRMGENTNLKENTMKKSELKALIKEAVEEVSNMRKIADEKKLETELRKNPNDKGLAALYAMRKFLNQQS